MEHKLFLGQRWGLKLTLLEGYAAFLGLLTWLPEVVKRGSVVLRVDNTGFVYAFQKGHSRDPYVYTLVKALRYVAEQLEFRVHVVHVSRRTSGGDQIVDYLSKGEDGKVRDLAPESVEVGIWSKCFLNWIKHPRVSWDLGRQIMVESESWKERVGRDFRADMRKVFQLLKWKKQVGEVGRKRKREKSE